MNLPPTPTAAPKHLWIERAEDLPRLAAAIVAAPWVALDTESNSMFVYRERVCLLQLNAGGEIAVVDTLAIPREAVTAALGPALAAAKRIWLHGGEYDVACMKRDFSIALANIYDTQQAASLLGYEATGYGAVVERLAGVRLNKSHTQYNWGTRPLDPEALRYAIDDVVHLPVVADALVAEVAAHDLDEEVAIANAAVMATPAHGGFDQAGFWRIKGVRDLSPKALPVLHALYVWRDGKAKELDQPPGRLINNELLQALARNALTSFPALKRLGVRSWFLNDLGEAVIEVIKRAVAQPDDLPERPRHREVDDAERRRETRLKDWRRDEAARRGVPLQVVLPAKALEHLKQHGLGDLATVPQLGEKRARVYGEKLRELCS